MNAYMTNGSFDILYKIKDKYPNKDFYFMHDNQTTLAYYEDAEKTKFATAREYEVVISNGTIQTDGFVVMNNIPVTDEGRPIFEDQFKQRSGSMDSVPGFYALRVLRPKRGNTYVVFVQWKDEQSYERWKNSGNFAKAHKKTDGVKKSAPYSAGPSYVTTYHMADLTEG
ncbi:antibiotic biosynthesis monooxygenase family protein [Aquibacillus salsiterrae]|uniref:Antibiotic biosynthesis monooxygenase n=1 Tax=Aquibacillus salsiterrae TaxID=2950439 RepID=A0A9X3WCF8_9BACI|nr:antibiotic biosynthesis monooxygenase [Aquibacillus salsiterrae]MDC3417257.1 antibiotic biosynthesis monooxygenase [Aquibacillus salsiterrae]